MRRRAWTVRKGPRVHGLAVAAGSLLLVCGCGETTGPAALLEGTWGGPHFGLEVVADTARTRFDCAHGSVEVPIRVDRDGAFSAPGEYVVDVGPNLPLAATYEGTVHGDRLDVRVRVRFQASAEQDTIGPFVATRNGDAEVIYCR